MFMCGGFHANLSKFKGEEKGCDLAKRQLLWNDWFTFHFKVVLPRSMSACLPGLLETQSFGQKQLLHKDTPNNYFQQQSTFLCRLLKLNLYMPGKCHRQ